MINTNLIVKNYACGNDRKAWERYSMTEKTDRQ